MEVLIKGFHFFEKYLIKNFEKREKYGVCRS